MSGDKLNDIFYFIDRTANYFLSLHVMFTTTLTKYSCYVYATNPSIYICRQYCHLVK